MATRRAGPSGNGQLVPDRLLKVDEAAAMLGLKPATLYQWTYQRRIPVVKLMGRALRFRESDLQKLIAEGIRPALGRREQP
jgi:excisionase family DNA binding protein